jgi:CelD/BcsL family acetyltransferase involved in cellulose biosynthesis
VAVTSKRDPQLELLGDLAEARGEWAALAERSGNVFSTWEWAAAWWRHLGHGRLLLAACRSDDGELAAILPLYQSGRRPLRTLRFLGHGPGDELGPVAARAQLPAAARALGRLLSETEADWDVFLGDDLPAEPDWLSLAGARTIQRTASPVLEIDGMGWDDFLGSRTRSFREQLRRQQRRLARDHAVRYRLVTDRAQLSPAMTTLIALHGARWHSAGGTRAFAGRLADFHRDFAGRALDNDWLRLFVLELDDRPAAALYNFRYGGSEWYYQSGRDPTYDRWSVGFLLQCHAIREAIEQGMRQYRFLRGAEPYKYRFAVDGPGVLTAGRARSARGRVALAVRRRGSRLPRPVRRRLVPAGLAPYPPVGLLDPPAPDTPLPLAAPPHPDQLERSAAAK